MASSSSKLLLLALVGIVATSIVTAEIISGVLVDEINTNQNSTWTAEMSQRLAGMTFDEMKTLLGTELIVAGEIVVQSVADIDPITAAAPLPTSFDARQQWPYCVSPIRDQGACGSCWAFSSAAVLQDRFCIVSSSRIRTTLSPQNMVSCDAANHGCQGGSLGYAWRFLQISGTASETCYPYASGNGASPPCRSTCSYGGPIVPSKAKSGYRLTGVENIMREIMTNGPVQAGYQVFSDFYVYRRGVYRHVTGSYQGGHAIRIVGWGTENNVPYWLVANSWGTSWGDSGYFKIARGTNECGIEDYVYAGQADYHQPVAGM